MSKKVFIIDDDPTFIKLMTEFLENNGYDANGSADLLDLILLDVINLPNVFLLNVQIWGEDSGMICSYLKGNELTGAIPVILFSKLKRAEQSTCDRNADDFILIPFEIKMLCCMLDKVTS